MTFTSSTLYETMIISFLNMLNLQGDEIVVGSKASLEEAFETSVHVLKGELKTGAQEHFYMETQATLAIPHEDKEMELFGMTCHSIR